jgi:hypothetical protein
LRSSRSSRPATGLISSDRFGGCLRPSKHGRAHTPDSAAARPPWAIASRRSGGGFCFLQTARRSLAPRVPYPRRSS